MAGGSRLAHGQRCLLAIWLVLLAGCLWLMWREMAWPWSWLGAAVLLGGHASALALELCCARLVQGADAAPRPTWRGLGRAWWVELRWSLRVFVWQQPFVWRRHPDPTETVRGARAVVLVHGFLCNRGFWLPWLERLSARQVPYATVSLEPVFGGIDAYVAQVEEAVSRAEGLTGMAPVLVGHSMGGLAIRAWMAATPDAPLRVAHVVTIGTPHRGTWLARWSRAVNGRQMREGSRWLRALEQRERDQRPVGTYAGFTCWRSNADNVVFPPANATLPDADDRQLSDVPHVGLAFEPAVLEDVLARLR